MSRGDFKAIMMPKVTYDRIVAFQKENGFVSISQAMTAIAFSLKPITLEPVPSVDASPETRIYTKPT